MSNPLRNRNGRLTPTQCQALSVDDVIKKIEDQCMPIPESGCLIWLGAPTSDGYGQITWQQQFHRVHRLYYRLKKGEIDSGLVLDHKCRVKLCCNPDHLEPVTDKINVLRGIGLTAINSRKTHCPRGHPLTIENLSPSRLKRGSRTCKICLAAGWHERKRKRRAVLTALIGEP